MQHAATGKQYWADRNGLSETFVAQGLQKMKYIGFLQIALRCHTVRHGGGPGGLSVLKCAEGF